MNGRTFYSHPADAEGIQRMLESMVESANGDTVSLVYYSEQLLPHYEELARNAVEMLKEQGKDVSVIIQRRDQCGEIPIHRKWTVDLKGSIPVWVFRRWHRVGVRGLTAIIDGKLVEAHQGEIIVQNQICEHAVKRKNEL